MNAISSEDIALWSNNARWLFLEKKFEQFKSKEDLVSQLQKQNPKPELLTDRKTYVKRANFYSEYATVQVVYQVSNNTSNPNIRLLAFIFADNSVVTIATRTFLQQEHRNNAAAKKSRWRQVDNLGLLSKHVDEFQGPRTKHSNRLTEEEVRYLCGSNVLTNELQRIIRAHQGQIMKISENHRKEKKEIETKARQLQDVDESMLHKLSKKCSELEEENAALKGENAELKREKAVMEQSIKSLKLDCREALNEVTAVDEKKKALTKMMMAMNRRMNTTDEDEWLISL